MAPQTELLSVDSMPAPQQAREARQAADGVAQQPKGASSGRRNRNRKPKLEDHYQQQQQQSRGGQQPPPGLPPLPAHQQSSLTWQQREQFLSVDAQPFQPSGQDSGRRSQLAAAHPQERSRQGGRSTSNRRGRGGRGRGAAAGTQPAAEFSDMQQQEQLPGVAADPAAAQAHISGSERQQPLDPQQPPPQQQQQQQQQLPRTNSRQRFRDRPPRGAKQQRGAGASLQQPLEAAASAAANRRQRQQQQAESDAADQPSPSVSDDGDEVAATGQALPAAGANEAANQAQPQLDPRQRQRAPQQGKLAEAADPAATAASGSAAAAGDGQAAPEQAAEAPHCLVCCSEMAEVGFGPCNHKQVCGTCTLRLRLCYGRKDCPLCKTELKEVIIAPWRPQLPDWQDYQQRPEWVARSTKWAKGEVCADRWRRGGRLSSRLLHDLSRRTALACGVCDPGGAAPFARREHLLAHVKEAHGRRLCSLCLQEGRLFPLELEAFEGLEALQAHASASHPHCEFCRRTFYDDDALWKHMHQVHYSCHVCPPPVAAHAYFNRSTDLLQHMRREHFMCEEPECADCFIAFATAEELRRHHLERHSARMPRWDPSRARPLQLDISFTSRSAADVAAAARRQRPRARPQGPQDVRVADGGLTEEQSRAGYEYAREADGGLLIIDDADFPSAAAAYPTSSGSGGGLPLAGGSWAGRGQRQRGAGQADDFPSLSAAAAAEAGGSGGGGAGATSSSGSGGGRPPPLVKKTAKCPCGRRVSHYAVAEGQEVPPMECDAVCRIEGRRQQLASAFGVDDPQHHASYFERHRSATYSGLLLAAAQQHPRFVEGLERQLAEFVADKAAKRTSLTPMPREQRAVAHALAEQYGLATSSVGQEPGRCVELFRTPTAGIPARLLSRVAPTVPPEEVAKLLRESEGHPLRLTDIAMSVDLRYYLRQWEGTYSLEWQGGDAAVVRFEREQDLKDALDVLGGGIRGLFRVDRSWRPKTAVAAMQAPAPGTGAGSRGWAGADSGSRSGEAESTSSSWTAVAVAPQPTQQQQQQQQQAAVGSAAEPQRWAVMTGRRAARPMAVASSAGSNGSRNVLADMMPEEHDVLTSDASSDSDGA